MNGRALALLDSDKLAKICGLFGSSEAGERAVAAAKAHQMIRECGLTWFDVLYPHPHPLAPAPVLPEWREPRSWREAITICLGFPDLLTDWEIQFVRSVGRFRDLSDRQFRVLCAIVSKIRGSVTEAG